MIKEYMVFMVDNMKVEAYRSRMGLPCIAVYHDSNSYVPDIDRQISPLKWNRLFDDLFEKVNIDSWEKRYSGYDRIYFRLSIDYGDQREPIYIQGNGGCPDNFNDLFEIMEPYLSGKFEGKNVRRHSKGCEYI